MPNVWNVRKAQMIRLLYDQLLFFFFTFLAPDPLTISVRNQR